LPVRAGAGRAVGRHPDIARWVYPGNDRAVAEKPPPRRLP